MTISNRGKETFIIFLQREKRTNLFMQVNVVEKDKGKFLDSGSTNNFIFIASREIDSLKNV